MMANMKLEDVKYLIIHCSDTYARMDTSAKDIDEWHKARGWDSIGYHGVIRRDGSEEAGRDFTKQGAHASGYNHCSIGWCLIGGKGDDGKPEDNFTEIQKFELAKTIMFFKALIPGLKVIGHNEVSSKTCPNFNLQEVLDEATEIEERFKNQCYIG
jgi:hypothetical protein